MGAFNNYTKIIIVLKKKTKIQVKNVFTKLKTKTIFEKLQLLDVLFKNLLKIANYFQMMAPQVDMVIYVRIFYPIPPNPI